MAAMLSAALIANGLMSGGNACSTSECVTMPSSVPRSPGALTTGRRRMRRRIMSVAISASGAVGVTVSTSRVIHMLTNMGRSGADAACFMLP